MFPRFSLNDTSLANDGKKPGVFPNAGAWSAFLAGLSEQTGAVYARLMIPPSPTGQYYLPVEWGDRSGYIRRTEVWDQETIPLGGDDSVQGALMLAAPAGRLRSLPTVWGEILGKAVEREWIAETLRIREQSISMLVEMSQNIVSTPDLNSLMTLTLDQLQTVFGFSAASLLGLVGNDLRVLSYRGPLQTNVAERFRFPLEQYVIYQDVIQSRQPVIINDVSGNSSQAVAFREAMDDDIRKQVSYIRSWMGIPLMVKDRVIGMIAIDHRLPDRYTPRHAALAMVFANQAALAIENARLHEAARDAAVAAERSRLARDLHDAVTQTLFSVSLIADVLPRIWQRNEDEGRRRLEELRSLTRAALAEMRTLLYELRPNTLIQTSLPDLLHQLVDAAAGRAQMHVTFSSEGKCVLPPDVQVGIYRIAQEALNNVARHACANTVTIHLNGQPGRVELWIADDGCGFDPATVSGNHFGLGIMRERAEAIGATLKITSRSNGGTQVLLLWQARRPLRLPGQPLPIDRG